MKILITGVAGLFGVHFSKYLLDQGHEVIGVDDLSGGYAEFVDKRVKFHSLDIADNFILSFTLKNIFEIYKPDIVYHFAAYAAEGLSPFMRRYNYQNNVMGSANLINHVINNNCRKIVFTSSMAVYGDNNPPFTENQIPCPVDPYGIAKYAVEMDIKSANRMFGLEYTIIRPHNVLGIYQNIWDKYRNVIGIWIRQVLNNEAITVYGDGQQVRAFSDIKYYMEPLAKTLTGFSTETFNIGADKYYKLIDVANIVADVARNLGYKPTIVHLETRDEVKIAYCNHDKAKTLLNFEDKTDIEQLVYEMFDWAKDEPVRKVKKHIYEIDKNIYSYWK